MENGADRQPDAAAQADGSAASGGALASGWVTPTAPKRGSRLKRILVGAVIVFASMSLLYGPANAAQMAALAVVCTVGIGLIPIVFVCWLVGWIALEIWAAVSARAGTAPIT